jgi:hypothetical protein
VISGGDGGGQRYEITKTKVRGYFDADADDIYIYIYVVVLGNDTFVRVEDEGAAEWVGSRGDKHVVKNPFIETKGDKKEE